MITCKVGNAIINCFDNKYDKFLLKKWDSEKRLICPSCGNLYEYCHGEIVSPYFRHKEKSKMCDEIYSEPETEEHIKGKIILYNWIKQLKGISNLKLEGYIPETRQRPDIYFELDNKRYVLEIQCSPIATEYLERHRLYELAGIIDIWIMGVGKYNIDVSSDNITHSSYYKTLEGHSNFYLNYKTKELIFTKKIVGADIYKYILLKKYYSYYINKFYIEDGKIKASNEILDTFEIADGLSHEKINKQKEKEEDQRKILEETVYNLNYKLKDFKNKKYYFKYFNCGDKYGYNHKIIFSDESGEIYSFFVNDTEVDCCVKRDNTRHFMGKRGGVGWKKYIYYFTINLLNYEKIENAIIEKYIQKITLRHIEK